VADPYALSPDRAAEPDLGGERDLEWVSYDRDLGIWAGPFLMAGLNTRVVRRSNALQGWAYGRRFRYREVTGFGTSPVAPVQAAALGSALKALAAGLAFQPSRALLGRFLPAPGQGPGEKTRRTGFFRMEIHTRTSAGRGTSATSKPKDENLHPQCRFSFTMSLSQMSGDNERSSVSMKIARPRGLGICRPAVQSAAMTACHRRFLIAGQRPGPSNLRCHRTLKYHCRLNVACDMFYENATFRHRVLAGAPDAPLSPRSVTADLRTGWDIRLRVSGSIPELAGGCAD